MSCPEWTVGSGSEKNHGCIERSSSYITANDGRRGYRFPLGTIVLALDQSAEKEKIGDQEIP
jgi:hypothetical protein